MQTALCWPRVADERAAQFGRLARSDVYVKLRFHIASKTKLYSVTPTAPEATMWRAAAVLVARPGSGRRGGAV